MPRSPITVKAPSSTAFCGGLSHFTGSTREIEPGCSPGKTSKEPWQPSWLRNEQARRLPRGGMRPVRAGSGGHGGRRTAAHQLAQHVRQDPAVLVVVDLDRGVDARFHLHLAAGAVLA